MPIISKTPRTASGRPYSGPARSTILAALGVMFAALAWLALSPSAIARQGGFTSPLAAPSSAAAADQPVTVTAHPRHAIIERGGHLAVAIVLDHAGHFHTWPSADQDVLPEDVAEFAIRTAIEPTEKPAWVERIAAIQWPTPSLARVADPTGESDTIELMTYQDRAIAYVPIVVAPDAPLGPQKITFTVGYQACDEMSCQPPDDVEVTVSIEIVEQSTAVGGQVSPEIEALFADLSPDAFAIAPPADPSDASEELPAGQNDAPEETPAGQSNAPKAAPATRTFLGFIKVDGSGIAVLLLAVVGGLVLNLTPCVLPVIPIKVMTISSHARNPGHSMVLGLWMAAGVVAFWIGISIPAALFTSFADPSRIFGIWWVTTGIGAVIAIMSLGLMGLFEIRLPQSLYMIDPKVDSPWGSFLFGIMTAVLGLPCFGFVVGALLPASASAQPAQVMGVFTAIGVGMALPYLILSANPALLKKVPRTGPASELVKQVMGLLLLAAAAFFIGSGLLALVSEHPYLGESLHWWAVAVFSILAGGLLLVRTFQITRKPLRRAVFAAVGIALAAAGILTASGQTAQARNNYNAAERAQSAATDPSSYILGAWNPYTPELVAKAGADGKVVMIDFTAKWCLNCQALKAGVLNRDPVKSELIARNVVTVTADLTSRKAPGWDKLKELGYTGIPLLVIDGPGITEPWTSNFYTSEQVLEALAKARG